MVAIGVSFCLTGWEIVFESFGVATAYNFCNSLTSIANGGLLRHVPSLLGSCIYVYANIASLAALPTLTVALEDLQVPVCDKNNLVVAPIKDEHTNAS